jgi:hypothetical protein
VGNSTASFSDCFCPGASPTSITNTVARVNSYVLVVFCSLKLSGQYKSVFGRQLLCLGVLYGMAFLTESNELVNFTALDKQLFLKSEVLPASLIISLYSSPYNSHRSPYLMDSMDPCTDNLFSPLPLNSMTTPRRAVRMSQMKPRCFRCWLKRAEVRASRT